MKTRIITLFCVFLLLAPLAALAGPAPLHRGGGSSTTSVSGVYLVTFNLNVASTIPAGATIVCKAQIAPNTQQFFSSPSVAVPVESASGLAQVAGTTATCAVEIPFSWSVTSSSPGVVLSYEITAVNPSGSLPALVRVSGQQGLAVAYPSGGGTSALAFNVTF